MNRSPGLSLRVGTIADAVENKENPRTRKDTIHTPDFRAGGKLTMYHEEKHLVHMTRLASCTLEVFLSDPLGSLLGSSPSPQPTWKTTA